MSSCSATSSPVLSAERSRVDPSMSRLGTPPSRRTQAQDRVSETTRLALVGAGLFGRFILQAASDVPQVEALVVADTAVDRADQLAAELGCRAATVEEALASSDTDAVV